MSPCPPELPGLAGGQHRQLPGRFSAGAAGAGGTGGEPGVRVLTGTHLHSSLRAPGTACSGWSRHSPALGRAFRTRQRGRSRSPQVPTFLGTTSPGSLHPGGRPGEATMSLLPGCHWLRYPPVPTLKGTPLRSPCPGTSPPARLPARLPLARGAAGSSPSPVPSSSSRKTGNAMGLVRGSLRLAGLGGGCCFPVSRWHTPQPRDPEQAARQRPELYRAPGERGEAPPRPGSREGGSLCPTWHRRATAPVGPPQHRPPRLGPSRFPGSGGHRWHRPRAVGGPSLGWGHRTGQ